MPEEHFLDPLQAVHDKVAATRGGPVLVESEPDSRLDSETAIIAHLLFQMCHILAVWVF